MLGQNCTVATQTSEDSGMSFIEQSDTSRENLAPVKPDSPVEIQSFGDSQQEPSPIVEEAGDENSSMEETGFDSDSGSGSESSNDNDSILESPAEPEIPLEKPSSLPFQENLSVIQKTQVNPEPASSREPESNLPLKGNQNTNELASKESVKKKRLVQKKIKNSEILGKLSL